MLRHQILTKYANPVFLLKCFILVLMERGLKIVLA